FIVEKRAGELLISQNAGDGELYVQFMGPAEAKNKCIDNSDGTCSVEYVAPVPGEYTVGISYGKDEDKQHIPGSPFHVIADMPNDPSRISVSGLRPDMLLEARVGSPVSFSIDASQTAEAPISVTVPPIYQQPLLEKEKGSRRLYRARFTPVGDPGSVIPVEIMYDGKPIPSSPYRIKLLPETEVNKVKVCGVDGLTDPIDVFASREATVFVDVSKCGRVTDVKASVVGPDSRPRDCVLEERADTKQYELRWPTDMAGNYKADIIINGEKVDPPITVYAKKSGDKNDVKLTDKLAGIHVPLGELSIVSYDRVHHDSGAHLAVVPRNPAAVKFDLESKKIGPDRHRDIVKFRPTKPGVNTLDVYYGGDKVDEITYEAVSSNHLRSVNSLTSEDSVVEKHGYRYTSGVSSSNNVNSTKDYATSPSRYLASSHSTETAKNSYEYKRPGYSTSSQPSSPSSTGLLTREFTLKVPPSVRPSSLKAIVTMPSKETDQAEIVDNHDVKYVPKKHGSHELAIVQDGAHITGSPLRFYVDSYDGGYATVYGPGLQNTIVGEPAAFTVCAKGTAAKELSVTIEGPAQSRIKIHDNKDGTCSVTWIPPVPGEYKVHVKLGGKEVHDSPFTVLVAGEGQKRAHLSVGSTSEVALNITQSELKGISASIKSPSGIEEPCFVRLIEGGRLGVSFTPREAGEHLISVKRDGKLLPKAPFKIKVDKSQVGDASRVEVSGPGKKNAECMKDNEILIDTSKAGYGGLSVSVQGPSKAELSCKEVKAGLIKVLYKPTEPGVYVVAVKFADSHVKDSPFTVQCTGKGAGRKREEISRKAEQAGMALVGKEALLYMKLPNVAPMDSCARILDPKGHTEDVEMRDLGDQFFQVRFFPKMEGVHHLSILNKDAHIYGSPFQFTVGPFAEGGAHKVRASGQGVVRGETNSLQTFNIYTREAGPGNLVVSMEGPSKPQMEFEDHKDGNCHVRYKVAEPGEYIVGVKFNDQHITDSPFKACVFIAPATGEVRKLELAQFHDQGIPAGKAFTFTVLTHRANGHLEAKVVTPSNEIETIDIVPIEDGESYAMRFLPKEAGNHYIHVTLDGAPMRDSPFRLRVGGRDQCDPTAISVTGDGIKKGSTGQKCEFIVVTSNAGAGTLTVQLDGPSKATLNAYELERGYKVRYTPLAPGDYYAAIKYNGIHIPGSPFKIPVDGKVLGGSGYNESSFVKIDAVAKTPKGTVVTVPEYKGDASKVEVKGAGLNKFFPGRPATFTIDTALAGPNILMVGVVTTKGPCEEVTVKHHGSGHYIVTYKVPERIKGFIFIKYGEEEIPGSPFAIEP
ncbi:Filamin-A, partial [Trichostrongylus colubriformis]